MEARTDSNASAFPPTTPAPAYAVASNACSSNTDGETTAYTYGTYAYYALVDGLEAVNVQALEPIVIDPPAEAVSVPYPIGDRDRD
jgi:hypothetical protein